MRDRLPASPVKPVDHLTAFCSLSGMFQERIAALQRGEEIGLARLKDGDQYEGVTDTNGQ